MKGAHVPLEEGDTPQSAGERFLRDKKEKPADVHPKVAERLQSVEKGLRGYVDEIVENWGYEPWEQEERYRYKSYSLADKYRGDIETAYIDYMFEEDGIDKFREHFEEQVLPDILNRVKKEHERFGQKIGDFEIRKETKKGIQLRKDEKTFWVQKRWIRDDGTLTPAGQKAFEDAKTDTELKQERVEAKERWERGVKIPKPDYESDKAYGFDIHLDFYDIEQDRRHRIFIPKSVIQENGNIPSWILKQKFEEITSRYPQDRYGGYTMETPFKHDEAEENVASTDVQNSIKSLNIDKMPIYTIINNRIMVSNDGGNTFTTE